MVIRARHDHPLDRLAGAGSAQGGSSAGHWEMMRRSFQCRPAVLADCDRRLEMIASPSRCRIAPT